MPPAMKKNDDDQEYDDVDGNGRNSAYGWRTILLQSILNPEREIFQTITLSYRRGRK